MRTINRNNMAIKWGSKSSDFRILLYSLMFFVATDLFPGTKDDSDCEYDM
jgi:hypothetical protein